MVRIGELVMIMELHRQGLSLTVIGPHASPHSASVTYNEGEFGRAARNSRKDGGWLARRLAFDERLGELVSRAKIRF